MRENKKYIIVLYLFASSLLFLIPLPKKLHYKNSRTVEFENGIIMRITASEDDKIRFKAEYKDFSPLLIKTTLFLEDKRFFYHPGFDPFSIARAIYQNLKYKRIVSGASTITMQLARILEPKKRTILSKILELLRAVQFEVLFGKKKIIETYLNYAPYGGNIEGAYAASLAYFSKKPSELLPEEVAVLVSIPKNPNIVKNKALLIKKAKNILKRMAENGIIDGDEYKKALSGLEFKGRRLPFHAPHLADYVLSNYKGKRIKTTLSFKIQKKVENIVNSYFPFFLSSGARNISIVVFDGETGELKAALGSFDYFDELNSGKIIGFNIKRAVGSTLKPFIYAMGIDEGVINPESLLEDYPHKFSSFLPENFDKRYRGLIKADDALSMSLNIPFVFLLKKMGFSNFIKKLELMDARGIYDYKDYGLTIATGGIELTLLELTNLYRVLRNGGVYSEFKIIEGKTKKLKLIKVFSKGSVYLTLKALKKRKRPDAFFIPDYSKERIVYWKTGTSWGRRDAWSIGFSKRYIVGVWSGNFSAKGGEMIYGSRLSAPVMFDVLNAIDEKEWNGRFKWFKEAQNEIEYIDVCKFSGYIPSSSCTELKKAPMLKVKHTSTRCPYHIKILIEKKTKKRACPVKKYKENELDEKIFLNLPDEVYSLIYAKKIPEYGENCLYKDRGELYIESPVNGKTYFIIKNIEKLSYIPLKAYTKNKRVYWYLDNKFIGESISGETIKLKPEKEGELYIIADDSSEQKTVKIAIKFID